MFWYDARGFGCAFCDRALHLRESPFRSATIRYSLWSHGRLLGHTDLDIPCVSSHLMQGFIDPTPEGTKTLPQATGVARVVAASRAPSLSEVERRRHDAEFAVACAQRDGLDLELRLDDGSVFPCDFMRVYDLRDDSWADPPDDEEPLDEEVEAEIEAEVEEWFEERRWGSVWPPPPPPDPRWDTKQYHIQVFLEKSSDIDDLLASPDLDDF